jgi:hypothetical protein
VNHSIGTSGGIRSGALSVFLQRVMIFQCSRVPKRIHGRHIEESKKECMRDEVAVDDVMGMEWRFEDREKL